MKATRITYLKAKAHYRFDYPWVVNLEAIDIGYLYGENTYVAVQNSRRATVTEWCYANGVNDWIIGDQCAAVAFSQEGDATLFYLAHA